jgi:hypothetical protein
MEGRKEDRMRLAKEESYRRRLREEQTDRQTDRKTERQMTTRKVIKERIFIYKHEARWG